MPERVDLEVAREPRGEPRAAQRRAGEAPFRRRGADRLEHAFADPVAHLLLGHVTDAAELDQREVDLLLDHRADQHG